MTASTGRGLALQLASVAASACAAVLAKLFLSAFSVAQFLLIFTATSVVVCAPFIDRASVGRFLRSRAGLLAIATNAVALAAFYYGLAGLHPGTHAFLSRMQIVFGFLLAHLMFKEAFGGGRVTFALLCMLSALMIAVPADLEVQGWLAAAATVAAAGLYAFNLALLRVASVSVSPATPVFLYNAALLPFAVVFADGAHIFKDVSWLEACTSLASALCSILSLYWYIASARRVTFFASTALRAASPVLVAALALPWFPLEPTPVNLIGLATMPLVLIAMAFSEYRHDGRRAGPGAQARPRPEPRSSRIA